MLAPSPNWPLPWRYVCWCGALSVAAWAGAARADDAAFTLRTDDYPAAASRVPAASIHYTDITGWLTPRQASSLGLSLGVVAQSRGADLSPMAYDLGLRWRSRLDRRTLLDLHAWARMPQHQAMRDAQGMIWQQDQPAFGTRLEVQWSSSRAPGWAPEFGAIGLQLEGNSRLLLRARGGGPMLYYRTRF